jgi:lipopolysaccharide transport system ATP-binding protein
MSDIAIRADGLSKQYRIGGAQASYLTLREALVHAATSPIRWLRGEQRQQNTIWALDDVSFEVKHGEAVGIIGRNGAGKSTLLKILSRITKPTRGRVDLYGRVGSLLEVGTGFHPELTGRENIFLNGAILGMTRAEIVRKFDEIVDFAEIEKFLDTPVKHYSSGMYVRLAFAVAAHLEPEILVVDEVLAVGDAEFQKKCLGKMGEVAKGGRTVLFVSHNMGAISSLCKTGILLRDGKLFYFGDVTNTINKYLENAKGELVVHRDENPKLQIQILEAKVLNEDNQVMSTNPYWKSLRVFLRLAIRENISKVYLALHIHDHSLETILFSRDFDLNERNLLGREPGVYEYSIKVPGKLLVPGFYSISIHVAWASPPEIIDGVDHVCPFEVIDDQSNMSKIGFPWRGKIATFLKWDYALSNDSSSIHRQEDKV